MSSIYNNKSKQVDFSITDSHFAPQNRRYLASLAMLPLYPAQSRFAKWFIPKFSPSHLDHILDKDKKEVQEQGKHYLHEVILERNGVRYCALAMGRKEDRANGKWILQAMGRNRPIELAARKCRKIFGEAGFNTLMINGPSIGRSGGIATPSSLGEAHEAGLQYLEKVQKAKKIVIAGHSMGAAVIGEAILRHQFKEGVKYLVIRQCAFNCLSDAVKHCLPRFGKWAKPCFGKWAKKLVQANGLEMDNVTSSKKLARLEIREVLIQAMNKKLKKGEIPNLRDFATDGVIAAESSLGKSLIKEGILSHKSFICIPFLKHSDSESYLLATQSELFRFSSDSLLERLKNCLTFVK